MRKVRTIFIFGVWVAVLPYLGFPYFWKNILLSLSGLGLIFIAYVFYRESKERMARRLKQTFENFQENSDFTENQPS